MLGQRRRRWPNIETALDWCLVFAGMLPHVQNTILNPPPPLHDGFPFSMDGINNAGSMLAHRLRRWPSIGPALFLCLVFASACRKPFHIDVHGLHNIGPKLAHHLPCWPALCLYLVFIEASRMPSRELLPGSLSHFCACPRVIRHPSGRRPLSIYNLNGSSWCQ